MEIRKYTSSNKGQNQLLYFTVSIIQTSYLCNLFRNCVKTALIPNYGKNEITRINVNSNVNTLMSVPG